MTQIKRNRRILCPVWFTTECKKQKH